MSGSPLLMKSGERLLKMKEASINRPQIIIVPPGFLKTTTTTTSSSISVPLKIAKISPKEPLKRPAPPESPLNPVRKRANLDHLSSEEKLLRRKLKNRVAAQNARDKKRVKMDDMEDEIQILRRRNKDLERENRRLREIQSRLEPTSGVTTTTTAATSAAASAVTTLMNPTAMSSSNSFSLPLSPANSSISSSSFNEDEEELLEAKTIILETTPVRETSPSLPAEHVKYLQPKGRVTTLGSLFLLLMTLLLNSPSRRRTRKITTTTTALFFNSNCKETYPLERKRRNSMSWGPRQKAWNPPRIWKTSLRVN
uniref:X-box-binding protein 1 n=1 Tax=Caligus clemensi TaxID=344056 RepID=C1C1E3_CALCM|nr:X-box-binding protein 1 [Caligus clemensi]